MKTAGKHLDDKQRYIIEVMLNENAKLIDIAKTLNKDPRGIKYEIIHHRFLHIKNKCRNRCGIQKSCDKVHLCNSCLSGKCKYCSVLNCNDYCTSFIEEPDCMKVKRFPYVCNGCESRKECPLCKYFYKSNEATKEYKSNISTWKKGPKVNSIQLKNIDDIVSEGVKKGHSLDIIIYNHNLNISLSTLYRYIDEGLLSVKNIDLKRQVTYRHRYTHKPKAIPINYDYLKGRTFTDFQNFFLNNPAANIWQMDTVEGIKGENEAAVLTLHYTKTNLQLYFKIRSICESEVIRIFDSIKTYLTADIFKEVFTCILTDNGKEFKDPLSLEVDPITGEPLIRVFYCDPRRSDQKGKCEKNHEHFREFIPKGNSMNDITHSQMNYISNNINNYPRKQLQYKTPLEASFLFLNKKVFELNKLKLLPLTKVQLKRLLIK